MTVVAMLSGNRNFEGRTPQHVKARYLASPALVVVYASTGTLRVDLMTNPIRADGEGVSPPYCASGVATGSTSTRRLGARHSIRVATYQVPPANQGAMVSVRVRFQRKQ